MRQADHPFFRPLWRRVAVIAACLVWSAVEWSHGETFWGLLTLGIAGWGAWVFLLNYAPPADDIGDPRAD